MSDFYNRAAFAGKQGVSANIVKAVHERNGRFLKDDGLGWVEVDDETAEKKVSHSFRTLRSKMKKADGARQGKGEKVSDSGASKRRLPS